MHSWICPKCSNSSFDTDKIAATGTGFSRFFDIQNKKFTALTCTRCKYTELYKLDSSMLSNVFDFFAGG
jgi:uncharacterized protein